MVMKMNLYEIDKAVMDCIDLETGEIVDIEKLDELTIERDEKIQNIALWIKNLKSDAEALKAEKDAFAQRQKVAENKADSLKKYLSDYLAGQAFKTEKVAISFRKSEAVEVTNIELLTEDFLTYKEPTVNKTAIKEAIKSGTSVPGAMLVENQNIQIK